MSRAASLVGVLLLTTAWASSVHAGAHDQARLALHVQTTCDKCIPDYCGKHSPNARGVPCSRYDTQYREAGGMGYTTFVMVTRADSSAGVAGVQFGVSYTQGFGVFGWTACGDGEYPHGGPTGAAWPSSGSGNRIVWDPQANCQRTVIAPDRVHVVVGAFYLYDYASNGEFGMVADSSVTPPSFRVVDCSGDETVVTARGGSVGHGVSGYNPCGEPITTHPLTWGAVKQLY